MSSIWSSFRASPLGELLTGSAHEAHPTDITASLGQRFAGQTVIAVHVALEKAATVRVVFDRAARPHLTGIRNIRQRATAEFGEVLRSEIAATKAEWAIVVMATGWQAALGQRAARPEPNETASPFARHRLMYESPEIVVPRAQVDRVYTAVDHPVLDKSIVFSVRRRELEEILAEIHKAGIGVAAVKIAIAAQLEVWLATQGEAGLARDLLLTDGLSALLLNTEQGDFVPPRGAVESEHPRQAVQRPSAIEEDIARFINANAGRTITFIGPEDLCVNVKKHAPEAEIVRPPAHPANETQDVALAPQVVHDLCFEAREVRPALAHSWRRAVLGGATFAAILTLIAGYNAIYAVRTGYDSYRLEREAAERATQNDLDGSVLNKLASDVADAKALRSWVASNYHAQQFCYRLLRDIPPSAALDKLSIEVKDGQITLVFVVIGDQQTQLNTHRAIETGIKDLKYKIGGEELPVGAAGGTHGVQYRMHIIVPDAAEASA